MWVGVSPVLAQMWVGVSPPDAHLPPHRCRRAGGRQPGAASRSRPRSCAKQKTNNRTAIPVQWGPSILCTQKEYLERGSGYQRGLASRSATQPHIAANVRALKSSASHRQDGPSVCAFCWRTSCHAQALSAPAACTLVIAIHVSSNQHRSHAAAGYHALSQGYAEYSDRLGGCPRCTTDGGATHRAHASVTQVLACVPLRAEGIHIGGTRPRPCPSRTCEIRPGMCTSVASRQRPSEADPSRCLNDERAGMRACHDRDARGSRRGCNGSQDPGLRGRPVKANCGA
jgi:hypothetical protein